MNTEDRYDFMEKMFNPMSIAIVGLSSKKTNIPRITLENLLRWGYRGRIFGINQRGNDEYVDGIKIYREIEDLPDVPDLVFCLIPSRHIPDMVLRCGRFGVRQMAISSGGFSELGEDGKNLADLTLKNARKYNVRLVGPNGLTLANTANGLCLPFVPLHKTMQGKLSIISQSGGVSLMMFNFLEDENIGLAKFASIGNKLDLDEVDFLEYFGRDAETGIICMYLESLERGRELIDVARSIDKPILIYKSNTTSAGKKAAMSHTAAVSNDEDIIDSAFEEAGIIRIYNYHDFFAIAKAFQLPPMKGRRIMVMSPAGGFSVITADLCEKAGFEFADPGEGFYTRLQEFTNAGVIRFSNPLDMGDIYDPQLTAHVFYSVMHSDKVDGAVYVGQRPSMPPEDNVFRRMFLTDLSKEAWGTIVSSGKPMGFCLLGPSGVISRAKKSVNFPLFNSPEEMVRALAIQMRFYNRKQEGQTPKIEVKKSGAADKWMAGKKGTFGEESLELLDAFGMPVTPSMVAEDRTRAAEYAEETGYPLVMKVVSPDALHKSDVGGVVTEINSRSQAEDAFDSIRGNLIESRPDARFEGVRIQPMAPSGYDMFVGGKNDESFGPVVFFGMGGVFIEVFLDIANLLCPADPGQV
ncbi:MAG: acetate--CoA ligase family protein, partial [Thermodesulfobacteriota bacterium]|nr:acetate--CoA ligase family protein [Thermodesulfobacteriota bacterium]